MIRHLKVIMLLVLPTWGRLIQHNLVTVFSVTGGMDLNSNSSVLTTVCVSVYAHACMKTMYLFTRYPHGVEALSQGPA